ncbi:MAG: GTPase Era [Myxococcus sp.]|nr:GTPase Era [Myxococcus sp.]
MPTRSGFAALIGRPNVGKSTLLNALAGEKLAIISPKPQTTRTRILGVVTRAEGQIAFVDTPGVHQAKGALNTHMVEVALNSASECDVVLFLVEAEGLEEGRPPEIGPGNRFVMERLKAINKPTILVVTKIDLVKKHLLLPLIDLYRKHFSFAEVLPVSARAGEGLDLVFERALAVMPQGPNLFPDDMLTDQAERALVAEYIREQVLRHTRQEIPYSAAVIVELFDESDRFTPPPERPQKKPKKGKQEPRPPPRKHTGLVRIHANIFVERDSQKAIIIGKRGQMLKTIGTDARKSIERLLATNVFLSLQVKVEERWSERHETLRRMGYSMVRE